MRRLSRILIVVGLLAMSSVVLTHAQPFIARILRVCPEGCDFQRIQAAIDAASTHDTILVEPGRYLENLVITKSVILLGLGKAERPIIEAKEAGKPVVFVINPSRDEFNLISLNLQNLIIGGARALATNNPCAESDLCPEGIQIMGAVQATLTDLEVRQNDWRGIFLLGSISLSLVRSRIYENRGTGTFALIDGGQMMMNESEITGNGYKGIEITAGFQPSQLLVVNSLIARNEGSAIDFEGDSDSTITLLRANIRENAGGISLVGASLTMKNSIVEGTQRGVAGLYLGGRAFISESRIARNTKAGIISDGLLYLSDSQVVENGIGSEYSYLFTVLRGGPGIHVRQPGQAILVQNEIRHNGGFGVMADPHAKILVCQDNQIFENGLGDFDSVAKEQCK